MMRHQDIIRDVCTKYFDTTSSLDCLYAKGNLSKEKAALVASSIAEGVALGVKHTGAYFAADAPVTLTPDKAVAGAAHVAKTYLGFSPAQTKTALDVLNQLKLKLTPSFIAADSVFSIQGDAPPDAQKLAAALYVTLFDHASTANPKQTAKALGYCVGLHAAATQRAQAARDASDQFLSNHSELLKAIAAVTLFLLVLGVVGGAACLFNLPELAMIALYFIAVYGTIAGVIVVTGSDSIKESAYQRFKQCKPVKVFDQKARMMNRLNTSRLVYAHHAKAHTVKA